LRKDQPDKPKQERSSDVSRGAHEEDFCVHYGHAIAGSRPQSCAAAQSLVMADVEIAVTAEEIEAEIIRSRLEAEGIPSRIAAKSQIGMPSSWSPRGLGYGIGSFSVRVPSEYTRLAREALSDVRGPRVTGSRIELERPPRPRARLIVRMAATVILLYLFIGMATWLAQVVPELF
jgi:hypothetical protein